MYDESKEVMPCTQRRQTLREKLEENKRSLQERLDSVNSALKFITDNPGFEEFHNIIGKAGY